MNKQTIIKKIQDGWGLIEVAESLCVEIGSLRNYMSANGIKVREIRTQVLRDQLENEKV